MKMHAFLILAAFLFVGAGDSKDLENDKNLKKMAGTWQLVSGEKEGTPISEEHVKLGKITWKGKECTLESPHQSKETIRATITHIDGSKTPAELDWTRSAGPGAGKTHKAIFEFLGPDEYRVCFAVPGKDRPTEFKTTPGSGRFLHVWKRVK